MSWENERWKLCIDKVIGYPSLFNLKGKAVSKQSFCSILYKISGLQQERLGTLRISKWLLGTEATTPPFNRRPLMISGLHVILGTASMEKKNSSVKRQVGWRSFTVLFHSWHCCVLAHIPSLQFLLQRVIFFVSSSRVYNLFTSCWAVVQKERKV